MDDTGCENYEEVDIEVIDLELTIPSLPVVCKTPGDPIDLPNLEITGTTGEWTVSGGSVTNNMDGTGTFSPSGITTSSVDLTYTLTHDDSGCSVEETISIDVNEPTVNLATIDPVCLNSEIMITGNPIPAAGETGVWAVVTGMGTGTLSADVNSGTATYEPTAIGSGSETLRYTFTDVNGCINSATVNVVVNPLPADPTINGALMSSSMICENAGLQTITAVPPSTGTGVWTSSNGGIDSQTNTTVSFDPSGYDDGDIILTYTFTDENGCVADAATHTITITKIVPTATASVSTVCASGTTVTLTGTPTADGTGVWTSPQNVTITNNNDGTATFEPTGLMGAIEFTYTFTETAAPSCVVSATTTVNVTAVDVQLTDYGTICKQSGLTTIIGSPIPKIGEKGIWSASAPHASSIIEDNDGGDGAAMFDPSQVTAATPEDVILTIHLQILMGVLVLVLQ